MAIKFATAAQREFNEARDWYEDQQPGLGARFQIEVELASARITRYPDTWPVEPDAPQLRKYVLNRFPYKLLYAIEAEGIVVVAVAHQHRRPRYWADRAGA